MEHETGSPNLPDISQDASSTPKPSLKQRIIPRVRDPFDRVLAKDRALHSYIEARFPTALAATDVASGVIYNVLASPIFAIVLGLLLGVLAVTGVVDMVVSVSVVLAWILSVFGIARSAAVKKLTVLSRLFVIVLFAVIVGLAFQGFGTWALRRYEEQQAKQKQQQDIVVSKEEPKKTEQPISNLPTAQPTPAPSPTPPASAPKSRSKQSKAAERQRRREEALRKLHSQD